MKKGSFFKLGGGSTLLLTAMMIGAGSAAAAIVSNVTITDVDKANFSPSSENNLVLDIFVPDAFNGDGNTEDIILAQGTNDVWQGETLNAIPALGAVDGIGYVNITPNGFQGIAAGEAVVIDHDGDSKYTSAPDTLLDGDGSATDGIGALDAAATAGDPLAKIADGTIVVTGGFALCTNNRNTPTAIRIDTDSDCSNGTKTEGTYILGTSATVAGTVANDKWSWGDDASMGGNGNGTYDDGEDLFKESKKNALTYSEQADTDVYSVGGIANGKALKDFPADCDKSGPGTQACMFTGTAPLDAGDTIVVDEGDRGGAAPNNVLDKKADQLQGLAVENTLTATSHDISAVKVWLEDGTTAGFSDTEDTLLGTMTPESDSSKHWRLGSLTQAIPDGGIQLYVTVDIDSAARDTFKIQMSVPAYSDANADEAVTEADDMGVFVATSNDGPSITLINASVQTIERKSSKTNQISQQQQDGNLDLELVEETEESDSGEQVEEETADSEEEVVNDGGDQQDENSDVTTPQEESVTEPVTEPVTEEPVVEESSDEDGEVLGLQIYGEGELIRGADMKIYRINADMTKTHVRTLEELAANHLGQTIHNVTQAVLDSYPSV